MIGQEELIRRARKRSEEEGDYWDNAASMLSRKPSLDRRHFTQKEWNWYQQIKAELEEAWE